MLDKRSEKGLLLYCDESSVYKVWMPSTRQAVTVRHLSIIETEFPGWKWYLQLSHTSDMANTENEEDVAPLRIPSLSIPQSTEEYPMESDTPLGEAEPQQGGNRDHSPVLSEPVPKRSEELLEDSLTHYPLTNTNPEEAGQNEAADAGTDTDLVLEGLKGTVYEIVENEDIEAGRYPNVSDRKPIYTSPGAQWWHEPSQNQTM